MVAFAFVMSILCLVMVPVNLYIYHMTGKALNLYAAIGIGIIGLGCFIMNIITASRN